MLGLTQVEEMLISAIMPIMSIYRLPHSQYGYSGHVVNLPQDVLSFATSLLRLPSEIDILVVRKEKDQVHQDFRVRRHIVQQALSWLLENSPYYQANQVRMNAEALEQLPEDGNLSSLMSVQPKPSTAPQGCQPSEEDPYTAHLSMQPTRAQSRRLFITLSKISSVSYITFSLCLDMLKTD